MAAATEPITKSDNGLRFAATPNISGRLDSLDAFRGLTIAGMILVNNPGTWSHIYPPLAHAAWHGWTPTDLIFPFFLFIVGVSMMYSFAGRIERGDSRAKLFGHVVRRAVIIWGLGLFMALFPFFNFAQVRIPGVLQRIAICYLFAAMIALWFRWRGQVTAAVGLLLGYWALLMLVPVPGYGVGRLDAEGNLGAYLDRMLLSGHMWRMKWDPEGMLSTLPAIATTLLGSLTGIWLRSANSMQKKFAGLMAAGGAGLVIGLLWDTVFPINKNIWTSSYTVFTAGFACVLLGLCYWVMDIRGWRAWAKPCIVYGMNAITVFVLSGLMAKMMGIMRVTRPDGSTTSIWSFIYQTVYAPLASPVNASLMMAISFVLFWLAAMWILYSKKIFIKI
jgi:predicted acyltransferase